MGRKEFFDGRIHFDYDSYNPSEPLFGLMIEVASRYMHFWIALEFMGRSIGFSIQPKRPHVSLQRRTWTDITKGDWDADPSMRLTGPVMKLIEDE